ncbi:MAG: hypothetical protein D4R81_06645, partial [Nitrospiraceae bacterium]
MLGPFGFLPRSPALSRQGGRDAVGTGRCRYSGACASTDSGSCRRQPSGYAPSRQAPPLGASTVPLPSDSQTPGPSPWAPTRPQGRHRARGNLSTHPKRTGAAGRTSPQPRHRAARAIGSNLLRDPAHASGRPRILVLYRPLPSVSGSPDPGPSHHNEHGRVHGRDHARSASTQPCGVQPKVIVPVGNGSHQVEARDHLQRQDHQQNKLIQPQFVTLKRGQNIKYRPFAFTEHGILMLSSVLNSERAVQV